MISGSIHAHPKITQNDSDFKWNLLTRFGARSSILEFRLILARRAFLASLVPMPRPFRAVIFDLDGVLADSEPWWNEIDKKLLGEYGVVYRGEYHRNVLGVSYRLAVEFYKKTFGLSAATDELMRRRGEIAAEFFANCVGLFPSTKQTLEELRQMNLHLAVATSSVSASARPFLDRHKLTAFFEVIVTGEEIERV